VRTTDQVQAQERGGLSAVAIIANGSSVLSHDLGRIPSTVKVMTVNRSWSRRIWPDVHLALDWKQQEACPAVYEDMAQRKILYVAGAKWLPYVKLGAHELQFMNIPNKLWSWEPGKIVEAFGGTGSVVYAAMQLACHLGHSTLYVLGLDLWGPRFDQSKASDALTAQNVLFGAAANVLRKGGIEVFNVGSPDSLCRDIPKMTFEEMLQREGGPAVSVSTSLPEVVMAEPQ
jgi:hypothetical protein